MAGTAVLIIILFVGVQYGFNTFHMERDQYFLENSKGLYTLPYFLGRVTSDVPRIVASATLFWGAYCKLSFLSIIYFSNVTASLSYHSYQPQIMTTHRMCIGFISLF